MLMGVATKKLDPAGGVRHPCAPRQPSATVGHPAIPAMSRWDALMDACRKRARPIVMTTVAMGAGMPPVAIGVGAADTSFRSPMAIAVIGGLITSRLSLLVIPAVFTYVDDLSQWMLRRFRRGQGAKPLATANPATRCVPPQMSDPTPKRLRMPAAPTPTHAARFGAWRWRPRVRASGNAGASPRRPTHSSPMGAAPGL